MLRLKWKTYPTKRLDVGTQPVAGDRKGLQDERRESGACVDAWENAEHEGRTRKRERL